MDTYKFLRTVLSDEGRYCVVGISSKGKVKQKLVDTIDDVVASANALVAAKYNAYYALGTFGDLDNRKVENVKYVKSFFLDLDCGEGKDYPNQAAALDALRAMCKTHKLPQPTIVNSGRGLHVYWVLSESVTYDEWKPVAESFKQTLLKSNFVMDSAVPADAARVLRVPNTYNFKDDPPTQVKVVYEAKHPIDFDVFSDKFGLMEPLAPTLFKLPRSAIGLSATMEALQGNVQNDFKLIMQKTMQGVGCKQLEIIATDQANVDEPLWRAGLSIAKLCKDSWKVAQKLSREHPDYDEDETYNKLDLVQGPYLCERFNEYNPDVCPDCPNYGKISTPLMLGREILEAEEEDMVVDPNPEPIEGDLLPAEPVDETGLVTVPHYPKPYFRGKTGGVYLRITDPDGNQSDKVVYHNDFYAVSRILDPDDGDCLVFRVHFPNDPMREIRIPVAALTSTEEFRKITSFHGVVATSNTKDLQEYAVSWLHDLQSKTSNAEAVRQFGWEEGNELAFILGDKRYTDKVVNVNYASSATAYYFDAFEPKGTLDGWKRMMDFYNDDKFITHQFMIAMSFGSPLMQFIDNVASGLLHVWSKDTGIGKSTSLLAGASIWGNPQRLMLSAKDTKNFQMNRAEVYKNIPLIVDELTNIDGKQLSDFAYELSSPDGVQRGRMGGSSNKERTRGHPWAMISVSTGNTSFVDRVAEYKHAPMAEAQRVLEINIQPVDGIDPSETVRLNNLLANNYGWAAPIYIQHIMANLPQVLIDLQRVREQLISAYKLTDQNRFWLALLSCAVVGIKYANQCGLVKFDTNAIFDYGKELVRHNQARPVVQHMRPKDMLSEFISEHFNRVLEIDSTGSPLAKDSAVHPSQKPQGDLVIRIDRAKGTAAVRLSVLTRWFTTHQLPYQAFEKALKEEGAKIQSVRLFAGTGLPNVTTKCLVVPIALSEGG